MLQPHLIWVDWSLQIPASIRATALPSAIYLDLCFPGVCACVCVLGRGGDELGGLERSTAAGVGALLTCVFTLIGLLPPHSHSGHSAHSRPEQMGDLTRDA